MHGKALDRKVATFVFWGWIRKIRGFSMPPATASCSRARTGRGALEADTLHEVQGHFPGFRSARHDPNTVRVGESFTARFTGMELGADTWFDVRFRRPGSSADEVAHDWQQGTSAS